MTRVRVPVKGSVGKAVQTGGSTTVNQTVVNQTVKGSVNSGVGGIAATIWPLVGQIPVPVLDVAALTGDGILAFDGTNVQERQIAVDPKLTITNPTGAAGNPTIGFAAETANSVLAGPVSGAAAGPTFRSLTTSDIPSLAAQGLSVALADVSTNPLYDISGSPITGAGTLDITLLSQTALQVFAGPLAGSAQPTFRSLTTGDIPTLPAAQISGLATVATTGLASDISGLATVATTGLYSDLTGQPAIPADISALTYLTTTDETASAPNSVELLPGANVTFDDSVPNQRTINATGGGGSGTVTSVGIADLSSTPIYAVSTTPITSMGTLDITLLSQSAAEVFAGPVSGSSAQPTFRSLATTDIPTLPAAQISGLATVATTGAYSDLTGKPTIPTSANPSAKVGLTAINGSAGTFMRSDGAPALDQTISPTMTGVWTWQTGGGSSTTLRAQTSGTGTSSAGLAFSCVNAGTDLKNWSLIGRVDGAFILFATDDAGSVFNNALEVSRSGAAITSMAYGNATNSPPHTFAGAITASGVINAVGANPLGDGAGLFVGSASANALLSVYAGTSASIKLANNTYNATLEYAASALVSIVNGTPVLTLAASGAVRLNAYGAGALTTDASGNVTATSDRRIKRKVRPFHRGLDAVLGLEPVLHGYRKDSGLDQSRNDYAGFIAQNVQEHIPEAVGEMPDGLLTLSDRPIIAALVNAVKELSAEVTALKVEIEVMKGERK